MDSLHTTHHLSVIARQPVTLHKIIHNAIHRRLRTQRESSCLPSLPRRPLTQSSTLAANNHISNTTHRIIVNLQQRHPSLLHVTEKDLHRRSPLHAAFPTIQHRLEIALIHGFPKRCRRNVIQLTTHTLTNIRWMPWPERYRTSSISR